VFGSLAKVVSGETVMELAEVLAMHHRPIKPDYKAKFGINESTPVPITSAVELKALISAHSPVEITPTLEVVDVVAKLTSSKLAAKLGFKNTQELIDQLVEKGFVEFVEGKPKLTAEGKAVGGEAKFSPKFGAYFIWPNDLLVKS
jgi:hypothetical protein